MGTLTKGPAFNPYVARKNRNDDGGSSPSPPTPMLTLYEFGPDLKGRGISFVQGTKFKEPIARPVL
jgi:hypothetical protein